MGTTGLNVKKGLNGMYLIRTDESEAALPSRDYGKILLINKYASKNNVTERAYVVRPDQIMKKNATYRFRILNSDFEAHYSDIRFVYNCTPTVDPNNCINISFTVIGADSALRKTPINGVNTFRVASAERIDLLIQFPNNTLTYKVFLHCFDSNITFAIMQVAGVDTTQNYTIPS